MGISTGVIHNTFYEIIDEFNDEILLENPMQKKDETVLFGNEGCLDSLALVNFIVATEQKFYEKTGKSITIADSKAMSEKRSPFRTLKSFKEYVHRLLQEAE